MAGELYHPDLQFQEDSPLSDQSKQCLPDLPETNIANYEVLSPQEVFSAALEEDEKFDIRPRVYDNATNTFYLVDTGSQCSVLRPVEGDSLAPHLRLETVDGSEIPCYGRKQSSVRLGRKTYHFEAKLQFLSNL